MKEIKRCPHCEAKMVEYKHALSKQIVSCLYVFMRRGGVIEFSQVNDEMTFNQKNNFQKLQYWGLISKVKEEGQRKGGIWSITEKGILFVSGKVTTRKQVWTYRNSPIREDGPVVHILDIGYEPYRRQEDYIADERPRYVDSNNQLQFFDL